MTAPPWPLIVLAYHLASRLAYVLYIGVALSRQDRTGVFTRRFGSEGGFRRFRQLAATFMYNDAGSFVVLCIVSRGTLSADLPRGALVGAGALLVLAGVSIKFWAAATLGGGAYYWRNFFAPGEWDGPSTAGPYRFLKNPMYTVGYLPTYGFALVMGSLLGLGAAVVDHIAILAFYRLVEKPHFEKQAKGVP
jgi:protein-S-isoprenylcysteine O-methyltransferase Ste14